MGRFTYFIEACGKVPSQIIVCYIGEGRNKGGTIDEENSIYKYDWPKWIGNKIIAFSRHDHTMYELDALSGALEQHRFCIDRNGSEIFYKGYFEDVYNNEYADCISGILHDNDLGDIASFFTGALFEEYSGRDAMLANFQEMCGHPTGTAGKDIYNYIRHHYISV